jgi:hypothetical protein
LSIFLSAVSCRPKVYSVPFVRRHLSRSIGHLASRDRQLSSPPSNVISVRSIGKLRQTVELEVEPGHYDFVRMNILVSFYCITCSSMAHSFI